LTVVLRPAVFDGNAAGESESVERGEAMNEPTHAQRRVVWLQPDGQPVSCEEKLKVLDENLMELRQVCQDAFEDALLMGCEEGQVRELFRSVIDSLSNPYRNG
jgi:hypothetical protein